MWGRDFATRFLLGLDGSSAFSTFSTCLGSSPACLNTGVDSLGPDREFLDCLFAQIHLVLL
jgi:hypothetical protein